MRVTGGVRFDVTYNLLAKLEYTWVRELGVPDIRDDVLTSSVVFRF